MCTRTKFAYGCGHSYRNTEDCDDSDCSGLDKYLINRDGDCKSCKREGSSSTRGRDGLGRYAKEIRRLRERSRSTTYQQASAAASSESMIRLSTTESLPSDEGVINPWVASPAYERSWDSPHRRKADDGWLIEHQSRISDLQSRLQNMRVSQSLEAKGPSHRRDFDEDVEEEGRRNGPEHDPLEDFNLSEDNHSLVEDEPPPLPQPPPPKYVVEVQRRADSNTPSQYSRTRSRRSYRPEVTQHSHDSLPDSMPSYRSSPRHKTQSTMRYTHPEQRPQYDYDQRTGYSTPRTLAKRSSSGRAKTEPYSHSRSNRSYDYDYDYAHPVILDSSQSYNNNNSPRYHHHHHHPQRSIGYSHHYQPHESSHMAPSYARYQLRY